MPGWLERLLSWQWPSPPDPLGAAGDATKGQQQDRQRQLLAESATLLAGMFGGVLVERSFRHPYWRGGLTWVGEGPELINLPRGTQVIPNDLSMGMAGAGAGGMRITVNATVSNKMDPAPSSPTTWPPSSTAGGNNAMIRVLLIAPHIPDLPEVANGSTPSNACPAWPSSVWRPPCSAASCCKRSTPVLRRPLVRHPARRRHHAGAD